MKNQFALIAASSVWIVVGSNILPILNGQEKSLPTPPDWVTSMPVSMNGKLPTSSLWFEGLELRRWHDSMRTDDALQTHPDPEFFRAVMAWLEEHDESLANAEDDLKRWNEWIHTGQTELIEKEHRSRLAKDEAKSKLP